MSPARARRASASSRARRVGGPRGDGRRRAGSVALARGWAVAVGVPQAAPARRACRSGSWRGSRGPSSSWTTRRSAPPSRRWVAKRWRSVCGLTPARQARERGAAGPGGSAARARPAAPPWWLRKTRRRAPRRRAGVALGARTGRPSSRYAAQRLAGRPAEQPDPLLAALAQHPDLAAPQVEAAEVRGRELADPQAGGVGGLDERAVAQRERGRGRGRRGRSRPPSRVARRGRRRRRRAARSTCSTSSTRGRRRGRRGVAIAPHGSPGARPVAGRAAMERPDGGQPLGDRRSARGPPSRSAR